MHGEEDMALMMKYEIKASLSHFIGVVCYQL